ncbi:hypothetical protein CBM2589_P380013 [Cupriavidus taiwanensis]|uniref:Uncharacterized protein n=2 Tax=Cupriavidus TaxID=106589 RepID=A0A375CP10_9BURK|nr:hypothetical protein CBM2589_P380013 [Cupriavidus taiwanensis]SPA54328.1 hypothetical protein CBM2606_P380009 [Cupriavidus taiwanensis]SPD37640.1 protein of unknown function [Cupriavidus taiwanensis]SPD62662.1 protein of unknown function [Cupriavidus neocaledonicus]
MEATPTGHLGVAPGLPRGHLHNLAEHAAANFCGLAARGLPRFEHRLRVKLLAQRIFIQLDPTIQGVSV